MFYDHSTAYDSEMVVATGPIFCVVAGSHFTFPTTLPLYVQASSLSTQPMQRGETGRFKNVFNIFLPLKLTELWMFEFQVKSKKNAIFSSFNTVQDISWGYIVGENGTPPWRPILPFVLFHI